MRVEFGKTLVDLARDHEEIVLLAGDYESGISEFKKNFPNRYFNMGTCEQSLISVAAGMTIEGLRPIVYSITPFILERPFEQVKICIDQQNVPVILVGYDDYPTQGPTHAALNAEGLAGLFKNIRSYFPRDSEETKLALIEAYALNRPSFIRLKRDNSKAI
ncbi:hypothetical protein J4438_01125 [Candidatus Woesearchaeota archaeon]|nr:hypothetical protein [Candidatus Woesearchaeota archaeon]